jgi:hypothetical protein
VRALPELVVSGSTGQPKAHPLLAEVRAHRLLLERLCTALCHPDSELGSVLDQLRFERWMRRFRAGCVQP